MKNPYDLAQDNYAIKLKVTDQHREIAKAVYQHKQHLGPLGMIEAALAIYDETLTPDDPN